MSDSDALKYLLEVLRRLVEKQSSSSTRVSKE